MIRLVATDLDGTLVRSDGTVAERSRQALLAAERAGITVVFVTARPLRWMDDLWPLVGGHGLAVVSNGAIVYDVAARAVLEVVALEPGPGRALGTGIREAVPGTHFAVEGLTGLALEPGFRESGAIPPGTPVGRLEQVWTEPAVKLLAQHDTVDPEEFRTRVATVVADRGVPTWSMDGLVEISAPGVTKGGGLARICARLGVAPAEVAAVGDMPNDLAMLGWAGSPYAVANAHPDVLAAGARLPANDDDGVAVLLETILADGR